MMIRLFAGLALAIGLGAPANADPKAVVELFTSQGCSSCPPADAYLAELIGRDDVVALSLHVNYWDYLGWKDTHGRAEHGERQRAYARRRGDGKVYTPQMVVNGDGHHVGSNRKTVGEAITVARLPVSVVVTRDDEALDIAVGGAPGAGRREATIWLATYAQSAEVAIQRGENGGRTIVYRNVVKEMRPIGIWKGEALAIALPAKDIMTDGVDGCAVVVQEGDGRAPGAILGAGKLEQPASR